MAELEGDTDPDPEIAFQMFSEMGAIIGPALILTLLTWLVLASAETAFHKNMLRGTDEGVFPLRFGKDELRVMIAQLCVSLTITGIYIGGGFVLSVWGYIAATSQAFGVVMGLLMIPAVIYWLFKMVQVMVRLAPAAAMSVRDEKQRVFEGWHAVKGRTWPVFGSFIIVYIIGYILTQIVVWIGLLAAFGNNDLMNLFMGMIPDDPETLFSELGEMVKTKRVMIPLVVSVFLYTIIMIGCQIFMWGVSNYVAQTDETVGES